MKNDVLKSDMLRNISSLILEPMFISFTEVEATETKKEFNSSKVIIQFVEFVSED